MMGKLHIRLFGDFCMTTDCGLFLKPKSKKAIALIALLATSDTGARQRRWLEDKLWSDRRPDQAKGSLRTTLVDIRKALGNKSDILGSDRSSIWLDLNSFSTDLELPSSDREFLEGIDIADDEFNGWLMQQRMTHEVSLDKDPSQIAHTTKLSIQCGEPWVRPEGSNIKSQIVNAQVGKIVSDFIAGSKCTIQSTSADLVIRTSVDQAQSGATIFVEIIDPKKDIIIHSDYCLADDLDLFIKDPSQLGRFCWNLADLALEKLSYIDEPEPMSRRSHFSQSALRHILSFEPKQMAQSLKILSEASERMDAGLFHALKAWAITSMVMEGFLKETPNLCDEIKMLLRKAHELSANDGIVAAVTSNVTSILFENYDEAIPLAQRALRENPNSVFALQAMSVCRAATGHFKTAFELSKYNQMVTSNSKFGAMCDLHHSLLCISMQRDEEAISSSRRAAHLAPSYRAPRRQLLGLYSANGQHEDTQHTLSELNIVEPEFKLDRFLYDRSYPSNTLRKSGYLEGAVQAFKDFDAS